MYSTPYVKSPRQRRAVQALLDSDSMVPKDMSARIGALNAAEIIRQLRQQGFHNIIFTRRFEVEDRDGHVCRPGEYYIPAQLKSLAEEALKKSTAPAIAIAGEALTKSQHKPNRSTRGV